MIDQLDIFSLPIQDCSSRELPTAALPINPKVEEAIAALREIKQIVIAQFQVGTRVISGDLHGVVDSVIDEILCMVHFDGEDKPRQVFTDYLSLEPSKPVLVEGCTVRSDLFFKGKTAKVIGFEQHGPVTLAIVEIVWNSGYVAQFPCGISALEVVE
jgi:hypothetical protein